MIPFQTGRIFFHRLDSGSRPDKLLQCLSDSESTVTVAAWPRPRPWPCWARPGGPVTGLASLSHEYTVTIGPGPCPVTVAVTAGPAGPAVFKLPVPGRPLPLRLAGQPPPADAATGQAAPGTAQVARRPPQTVTVLGVTGPATARLTR